MKIKFLSLILAVTLIILGLTSCGAAPMKDSAPNDFGYAAEDSYYDKIESAPEMEMPSYGLNSSTSGKDEVGVSNPGVNDLSNRKIIKTAHISFQTKTYDEFIASLEACIFSAGGYIESSESRGGGVYQSNYSRNAYITVRVPASTYDKFMSDVCTLGSVTHKSEDTTDVTIAYVDTESRIKALQAEYDALLDILEKATKLDDVIMLQSRISEVTYKLETYKSQLRKYDDLISYCTVTLDISEVYREVKNEERMTLGERISEGFADTLVDISDDLADFSVWFVSSIPYILIWAVIIAVVVIVIKRSIKKHKAKKVKEVTETVEDEKDEETI
ncbi:MAG: DUF4349 domain-containing protein [Ruminococcaceae bacterium]|nr:DUF4349 domain-containing protein [Oscillospiraceae bacterium]